MEQEIDVVGLGVRVCLPGMTDGGGRISNPRPGANDYYRDRTAGSRTGPDCGVLREKRRGRGRFRFYLLAVRRQVAGNENSLDHKQVTGDLLDLDYRKRAARESAHVSFSGYQTNGGADHTIACSTWGSHSFKLSGACWRP